MDSKNFITALVGSLLGLLPLLLSAFISWLEKRSRVARKEESIDFAQRRVTFLTNWLQARQQSDSGKQLAAIKKEVSAELDDIKDQVNSMMDIPHETPMVQTQKRNFSQRLFLFYPPHTAGGWVYRGLFFMCVSAILFFGFLSAVPDPTAPPLTIWDWVGYGIVILPFLLLALLFHALAVHTDNRAEKMLMQPQKS